jgi:hypothetical protein
MAAGTHLPVYYDPADPALGAKLNPGTGLAARYDGVFLIAAGLAGLLLLEFAVLRHWKEHGRPAGFGMVPQPELSRHPAWRKTFLWLVSLTGATVSLTAVANAVAPGPGHAYSPAGGVLGSLGLMLSAWIGWYAHRVPFDEVCDSERTARFSIVPRPLPAQHPTWRRIYLLLISLAGTGICTKVLVLVLAPDPGQKSHPGAGGAVLSGLGIVAGAWIAWYACRVPSAATGNAMSRSRERRTTRSLQD